MPYLELPGASLWYEDTGGDGTPVVLLHAFTGNTESWVHQLPAFTAAGYRCLTYDRRGWGRSRAAPLEEQTTYPTDDLHTPRGAPRSWPVPPREHRRRRLRGA